jgi:pimeloyl-ACP methyl ester carboxylesterase
VADGPQARTRAVDVGGGRIVTLDDLGPDGATPVLYLHGTPDSRLSRHPDDGAAAAAGVRLLALDRPGYGGSDPFDPTVAPPHASWPTAWDAAVARVLDALDVERCGVLAWSGGALAGLALAAGLPDRVGALGIVAGLVPRQAYDHPDVRAAAEGRLAMLEMADMLPAGTLGEEVAPLLAPYPCDAALAAEHQAEQRAATDAAELASVPGGAARMAEGLVEAVRRGLAGVAADVESQAGPLPVDLAAIGCPVRLWFGADDEVTPPAFGRWYADQVAHAGLTIVEGAGHYLALTAWPDLLAAVAADACAGGARRA